MGSGCGDLLSCRPAPCPFGPSNVIIDTHTHTTDQCWALISESVLIDHGVMLPCIVLAVCLDVAPLPSLWGNLLVAGWVVVGVRPLEIQGLLPQPPLPSHCFYSVPLLVLHAPGHNNCGRVPLCSQQTDALWEAHVPNRGYACMCTCTYNHREGQWLKLSYGYALWRCACAGS